MSSASLLPLLLLLLLLFIAARILISKKNPTRQQQHDDKEWDCDFLATRKLWCHVQGDPRDADQCKPCHTKACTKPRLKRLQLLSSFCKGSARLRDTSRSTTEQDKEIGKWGKRMDGEREPEESASSHSLLMRLQSPVLPLGICVKCMRCVSGRKVQQKSSLQRFLSPMYSYTHENLIGTI